MALRRCFKALIAGALAASLAAVSNANASAGERPLSLEKLERITGFLNDQVTREKIPGAVVLIARHGKPVYLRSFGVQDVAAEAKVPMSPDTIFAVYSMTKLVTSVAAMMLVDEGKLKPGDPLSKYIPEFADVKVGVESKGRDGKPILKLVPPVRAITIDDLMRHTAGISYDNTGSDLVKESYRAANLFAGNPDNATFVRRLARVPLTSQPGAIWRYGYSTDVLGRVIEIISGQSLYQFMRERLFIPLGMTSTRFVLDTPELRARMAEPMPNDNVLGRAEQLRRARTRWESGGGGLLSTINDYARFGHMILNGGELDGKRYLSAEAFKLMTTDKVGPGTGVEHDDNYYPGDGFGYGYGFGVRTTIGVLKPPRAGSLGELKWDSGSGTYFGVDPKEGTVYILMEQTGVERGRIIPAVKRLFYEAFEDAAR
ncbi:MAG: serine hydrolase domain-containing protein [Pseudomonadota bacterium]